MNTKYFIVNNEQHAVAPYVEQWGRAPSIALLDPAMHIFHVPTINGIIGYRLESNCALVFGDPLCAAADMPALVDAFHQHFTKQKKTIIYLLASEQFKQWALTEKYVHAAMNMGDEIILDPTLDPKKLQGRRASVLRNQYNQALHTGIRIKEYTGHEEPLEAIMEKVGSQWLENRNGLQTSLLQVNIFSERTNKRWFYAEYNNSIVGVFVLNKLGLYHGLAINMLLITPDAPKYTSEFILLSAFDILRDENCHFISLGTLPCLELNTMEGFGTITTFFAKKMFLLSQKIFKLNKRQQYWQKFHPYTKPSYLLLNKSTIGLRNLRNHAGF